MVLHNPPEMFIAAMVLDGVFEKFPRLMCGVIEQGALWVPALMRRIDIAQATFKKSEPLLAALPHESVGLHSPASAVHAVPDRAGGAG